MNISLQSYCNCVKFPNSKKNSKSQIPNPKTQALLEIPFGIWNLRFGIWDLINTSFYKVFGIILFVILTINVVAQDKPVKVDTLLPEKVLKTFTTKYPGKPDSQWVKEVENYIITFTSEGKWYDIKISVDGKWLETLVLINYEDLPAPVKSNFEKSEFANLEQLKVEQVESEKISLTYKLTLLSMSEDEISVLYDAAGNRVMK